MRSRESRLRPPPPSRSISCSHIHLGRGGSTERHGGQLGEGSVDLSVLLDFHLIRGLAESLCVVGPGTEGDQGGEVVGYHLLDSAVVDESHHAAQLGDLALLHESSHALQRQLIPRGLESHAFLSSLDHLHDHVFVLGLDSRGEDSEHTGSSQVLPRKSRELPDAGEQFGVLVLITQIHVCLGGLIVIHVALLAVQQRPRAILGLQEVSLEGIIVLPE
jgi:hypothetical protein